jgi:pimeloyl-ACP methyl ester carboxylesterase
MAAMNSPIARAASVFSAAGRFWHHMVCVLIWGLASAPSAASEPADWIDVKGATAEWVSEPVFGGRVMLYRAGPRGAAPVVLIHGLGQNGARDWSETIPALAGEFEVFALDLPGFAASDKGNHLYSPENFARVIDAVVAPRVSKPFTLIGHSMGGAVSLAYAAAYPERLSRLILVDMAGVLHRTIYAGFLSRLGAQLATGMYPEGAPWFDAVVRNVLMRAEGVSGLNHMALQLAPMRQRMLGGDPNAIAAFALVQHDFSHALRSVKAPTLVIWGSEDRVAPLRTGQLAASTIPGARLVILHGVGHSPQLQLPGRFNAIVLDELHGRGETRPYALPLAELRSDRVATCDGQAGQFFSGDYRQISLNRCSNAQITEARVGLLLATDSSVTIMNSHILGGINAKNSRLELTGGSVKGQPALVLDTAGVDAAGTRFVSTSPIADNRGTVPLSLHLSVTETVRNGTPEYVHEVVRLAPEQAW